jgi:hypothetical protein
MLTTQRRWTAVASILLGAAASGPGFAQEEPQPVTVNPSARLGSPVAVQTNHERPRSPYQQMPSAAAAPSGIVALSAEKGEPAAPERTELLPGPACLPQAGASPGQPVEPPALWQRFKNGLHRCFIGYPDEFMAPPLGDSLYAHGKTEVANGEAARMVLYDYDFIQGGDQLNLRGRQQLAKMMALLPCNFFPIVIQEKPDIPPLNGARRRAVLNELARYPFPVPAERVVVGRPIANGLRGEEAEIISSNRLGFTRLGGPVPEPQQRTETGTLRYLLGAFGGGAAPAGAAQPSGGPP